MKIKRRMRNVEPAKKVAGVGTEVQVNLEDGALKDATIVRMGPNPNITVELLEGKKIVEVPIANVVIGK